MSKLTKYIALGLAAASMAQSSFAITVNWNAFESTGLILQDGIIPLPTGDLIEIGTFATGPTPGSFSLAGFNVFGSAFVGTINGTVSSAAGDGFWEAASTAPAGSFAGQQIYLVVFNSPTAAGTTQLGIFSMNPSDNAHWLFPGGSDSTSIDMNDLVVNAGTASNALATGAELIFAHGPVFDPATGYSYLGLDIPEPSTRVLVAAGLLGLAGLSRRRGHGGELVRPLGLEPRTRGQDPSGSMINRNSAGLGLLSKRQDAPPCVS